MKGSQFGDLLIDPVALKAGQLRAFKGSILVLEAPAEEALYSLLTKRFVKTKQYTSQAVGMFRKLVDLAGLPIHDRKVRNTS